MRIPAYTAIHIHFRTKEGISDMFVQINVNIMMGVFLIAFLASANKKNRAATREINEFLFRHCEQAM